MLDHVVLSVSDHEKAKIFCLKALGSIGYGLVIEFHANVTGIGIGKKPSFIINEDGGSI